jgi:hypothetical protein
MKAKLIVFVLVVVAMVSTTLLANDIAKPNTDGKIIIKGWITGAEHCTIDVYQVDKDGTQYKLSTNAFDMINYYKVKVESGSDYILVFNNGKFTKHLKINNIRMKKKTIWNRIFDRRRVLVMDVDFTNRHSAKIEQHGNFYHFNDRL